MSWPTGSNTLSKVAMCKLARKPAVSKHRLFIWVNFFLWAYVWVWVDEKSHWRASQGLKCWKAASASLHAYLLAQKGAAPPFAVAVHYFWQKWPQTFWTDGRGKCWGSSAQQCPILAFSSLPNLLSQQTFFFLFSLCVLVFCSFMQLLLNYMLRFTLLFIPSCLIHSSIFSVTCCHRNEGFRGPYELV